MWAMYVSNNNEVWLNLVSGINQLRHVPLQTIYLNPTCLEAYSFHISK